MFGVPFRLNDQQELASTVVFAGFPTPRTEPKMDLSDDKVAVDEEVHIDEGGHVDEEGDSNSR